MGRRLRQGLEIFFVDICATQYVNVQTCLISDTHTDNAYQLYTTPPALLLNKLCINHLIDWGEAGREDPSHPSPSAVVSPLAPVFRPDPLSTPGSAGMFVKLTGTQFFEAWLRKSRTTEIVRIA